MNEQKAPKGIEWTRVKNSDGTIRRGFTWNPIAGCMHGCRWNMPDGKVAICYAENVAENVAQSAYPHGFEHHYWNPERLLEPGRQKKPIAAFVGSMADVFGHWVPEEQIEQVLKVAQDCPQHIFQFLTKNPKRLDTFMDQLRRNMWMGASTPPDAMFGKSLKINQQQAMFETTLYSLKELTDHCVTWLSAEPLSYDITPQLQRHPGAIQWMVIGAASDGPKYFPPERVTFLKLMEEAKRQNIKVFFKGNLASLPEAAADWHEEFPV